MGVNGGPEPNRVTIVRSMKRRLFGRISILEIMVPKYIQCSSNIRFANDERKYCRNKGTNLHEETNRKGTITRRRLHSRDNQLQNCLDANGLTPQNLFHNFPFIFRVECPRLDLNFRRTN